MKSIDPLQVDQLPGRRLAVDEHFDFACRSDLACFNRCCRNLNLFVYPYDVLRLRQRLAISAERFLDTYVDLVLRPGHHFPDVLLRMADNDERTCPFVAAQGCTVYTDRPFTCRSFPLEKGLMMVPGESCAQPVFFFRPPPFCLGPQQPRPTTAKAWFADPDTRIYDRLTERWAEIQSRFARDPWGAEGPEGRRAKMAFMATYNLDEFRRFVFDSSFLKRFKVPRKRLRRAEGNDLPLLELGLEWVELFVWGISGRTIRPRR
jgi:Fe-S-cluster containining protein